MVVVSYSGKEINAKLVYYGPGLSGKTTNLEFIYDSVPSTNRGKMVSMKTRTERTLFFDFLPVDLGEMGGFKTRFLLYTVPGQVYYNATRKLVLRGVDAVVFVADSGRGKMNENLESLENLRENLREYGMDLDQLPWVLQYNKRDLPDVYTIEEMNKALNPTGGLAFEAVATNGTGVFETFKGISKIVLEKLSKEIKTPNRSAAALAGPPKSALALAKGVRAEAAGEAAAPPSPKSAVHPPAQATPAPERRVMPKTPPAPVKARAAVPLTASSEVRVTPQMVSKPEERASLGQRIARLFKKSEPEDLSFETRHPTQGFHRRSDDPEPVVSALEPQRLPTSLSRVDFEDPETEGVVVEKKVRVPVPVKLTPEEVRHGVTLKLIVEVELTSENGEMKRTGTT